jgi:hypothetical protein
MLKILHKTSIVILITLGLGVAGYFYLLSKNITVSSIAGFYLLVITKYNKKQIVFHGKDNWLYLNDELSSVYQGWLDTNVEIIKHFSNELFKRNIKLVVVPIPNKIDVYSKYLLPSWLGGVFPQRETYLRKLKQSNVDIVNVLPALKEASKSQMVYYKDDTHWNNAGIKIAAQVIAGEISKIVFDKIFNDEMFTTSDSSICKKGDLATIRDHGDSLPCENVLVTTVFRNGEPFLSEDKSNVLIIGDSFNRVHWQSNAHIGAHIAKDIGYPLKIFYLQRVNVAGPSFFKNSSKKRLSQYQIVIWIFSERMLCNRFNNVAFPG